MNICIILTLHMLIFCSLPGSLALFLLFVERMQANMVISCEFFTPISFSYKWLMY